MLYNSSYCLLNHFCNIMYLFLFLLFFFLGNILILILILIVVISYYHDFFFLNLLPTFLSGYFPDLANKRLGLMHANLKIPGSCWSCYSINSCVPQVNVHQRMHREQSHAQFGKNRSQSL